ncbi:MAG: hypothetical protein IPH88_09885 [Bacteroidales bacterium]|nr:hypothetical protein [Bacteroidales bacterium]
MKHILAIILLSISCYVNAQDKYNYVHFNKLTEVTGTEFVIASIENWGKTIAPNGKYLVFIDTKTGNTKQVDFPGDGHIGKLEQVRIDSLGINRIILSAQTIDLDQKKGIDWEDPTQLIVFSTDGKERIQLTDSAFFARTWIVNRQTGTIVITGHYDSNNNKEYDKTDRSEIVIYDLKTLGLIRRI